MNFGNGDGLRQRRGRGDRRGRGGRICDGQQREQESRG